VPGPLWPPWWLCHCVLPANGIHRHAPCQRNGQVSLNAEAAHCLPVEWIGRRLTAEWAGLIKYRCGTSLVRQRALSAINAGAAQPEGLTSGSTRWLTLHAVGHMAASGLRLSGEQQRYADRSAPGWAWTRVGTGPLPEQGLGILCPRVPGPSRG
jgi:hypothetical protein